MITFIKSYVIIHKTDIRRFGVYFLTVKDGLTMKWSDF